MLLYLGVSLALRDGLRWKAMLLRKVNRESQLHYLPNDQLLLWAAFVELNQHALDVPRHLIDAPLATIPHGDDYW